MLDKSTLKSKGGAHTWDTLYDQEYIPCPLKSQENGDN